MVTCLERDADLHMAQPHSESVEHSPSRIGRVSDTLPMRLRECRTLSQCGREVSDTLLMQLGECPTLSQCCWESVGHSPNGLRECRTLSQCGWESVRHSPNAAVRVSDILLMRLGECPTLSQCGWKSDRHSPNAANVCVCACGKAAICEEVKASEKSCIHLCRLVTATATFVLACSLPCPLQISFRHYCSP